jgi:hypothetical protein
MNVFMLKTYDRLANGQTAKGNGRVTLLLLTILIVLLILRVKSARQNDQDDEHEQDGLAPYVYTLIADATLPAR